MTYLTRNGVAKTLKYSPYTFTEVVDDKKLVLYFSSMLHLNNFTEKREANYNMVYNYIYKRFKFKINCRLLADCNLYKKIETRGFYIKYNNKEYICPDNIILSGESKTRKSCAELQETLTTN